jgi:diguanylate cyclase (GGDEF)-like protein
VSARTRDHRPPARRVMDLTGALIIALGLAASAFFAVEWRSSLTSANKRAFESAATDVSGVVKSNVASSVLQTRTLSAIAALEPEANESRYLAWYRQLKRPGAAPLGVSSAIIQIVPASQLAAFRRQVEADPAYRALLAGAVRIVPSGLRSEYCLERAVVGTTAARSLYPPLLDYCAPVIPGVGRSPLASLIRTATDTASTIVAPIPGTGLIAIGEAVYRSGASPATVSARRAAATDIVGTSFIGAALVRPALAGRSTLVLALFHRNARDAPLLVGRSGSLTGDRGHVYSERVPVGEGWFVDVSGSAPGASSPNIQGVVIMGVGALVTLLLLTLYRVLARSRKRAWSLVGEKTGELEYRALHDPLTDLPNRGLVLDRAEQILARGRRVDVPVTALFMDIDDFKQVNDRHGHNAGDEVLRQVGARLVAVLRQSDTVGRLGGDEFVMLVDAIGLDTPPELVAQRILEVLRRPIILAGRSAVSITASIGIASGLPEDAEDLIQDADLALYEAKAAGKDCYANFESAMHVAAQDRIHLEMDLGEALGADQLFLVYQPMLDLQTERIVGVEALVRWQHPSAGEIRPDAFIPLAEDNGLIIPIGRWVLRRACAQAAEWRRDGRALSLSVNVSARQLERPEFIEEVREALHDCGLDPLSLTLEITETVLMRKPEVTVDLLEALKTLGVRIAIDDFGTGYSSLAYLRQFPVDSLKIDRTFITNLARSNEAHALTHTLIQLGKALGLETLAEGVEHHSQLRELQLEGCDLGQGFLFARPLLPAALELYMREHSAPTGSAAAARRRQVRAAREGDIDADEPRRHARVDGVKPV